MENLITIVHADLGRTDRTGHRIVSQLIAGFDDVRLVPVLLSLLGRLVARLDWMIKVDLRVESEHSSVLVLV